MRVLILDQAGGAELVHALEGAGHELLSPAGGDVAAPQVIIADARGVLAWTDSLVRWQQAGARLAVVGQPPAAIDRTPVSVDTWFPEAPTAEMLPALLSDPPPSVEVVRLVDGTVELATRRATLGGEPRELTDREAELLRYLAERPGQVVGRERLLAEVWGYAPNVVTRVVDATMHRLRAKLEREPSVPSHLHAHRGVGYRFVPVRDVAAARALPPPTGALVGRDGVLDAVAWRFADGVRLVTLLGPGGIGKTAVARAFAGARVQSTGWVDLSRCRDHDQALAAISAALGLRLVRLGPEGAADLAAVLDERGVGLLVLDGAEWVATAARTLVAALVARCPALRVLTTSQVAWELPNEVLVEVPPLTPEAATTLLAARVAASGVAAPDRADASAIVAQLDGVPLAVELAAGMLEVLDAAEVLRRLRAPDLGLDDVTGARPERQRSLRSAVRYALDLLDAGDHLVLLQCAAFRGSFTVGDIELCLPGPPVLPALRRLRSRSLVARGEDGRLRVRPAVREAALERATEASREAATQRVRVWAVREVERRCPPGGVPELEQVQWLRASLSDLQAAFEASLQDAPMDAVILAGGLYQALTLAGPVEAAVDVLDRAAEQPALTDAARSQLAAAKVAVLRVWQPGPTLFAAATEALRLAQAAGDQRAEGRVRAHVGATALEQGRLDEALAELDQAAPLHTAAGDPVFAGVTDGLRALARWELGFAADAARGLDLAVGRGRALGQRRLEAFAQALRGGFLCETGDLAGLELIDAAAAIHQAAGDELNRALALERRAQCLLLDPSRVEEALAGLEQCVDLRRRRGELRVEPALLHGLGVARVAAGRPHAAQVAFGLGLDDPHLGEGEVRAGLHLGACIAARLIGGVEPGGAPTWTLTPWGRAARLRDILDALRASDAGDRPTALQLLDRATRPARDGWPCHHRDVVPMARVVRARAVGCPDA